MFEDIERLKMWSKYVQELDDISGVRTTPLYEFLEDLEKTVKNPDTEWIDVRSPLDGVLVGFLIVGTKNNCHPDADYYIQEAYILPGWRRKGIMSSAVGNFVRRHEGVYCLFVLKKNEVAKSFWRKVFSELGYVEALLRDVGAGDEFCTQYGFVKIQ